MENWQTLAGISPHQLLFCYCTVVVGPGETLLNKKSYLEL